MQSGKVKVWYDEKGFGFLIPDNGGEDVFVHRHALTDGQCLVQGSPVTFKVEWNTQKNKYLASECFGAIPSQTGGKGCKGGKGGYGKASFDAGQERPAPYPMDMQNGGAWSAGTSAGLDYNTQALMQQAVQAMQPGAFMGAGAQ
mmetsp:Transcript_3538/g.10995  ORF Transcript_3538/g.10995 Transcript_3538/m.10995 type:complete len:144 (+) Transcript_3538:374-805(+)